MVRINRKYLEADLKEEIWKRFLKEFIRIKSPKDLPGLLEKFFTSSEIVMLEKRLAIKYLIEKGLQYRKISETIDVAPATISFVKNGLKFRKKENKSKADNFKIKTTFSVKKRYPKYPTYKGRGRWRFLNM